MFVLSTYLNLIDSKAVDMVKPFGGNIVFEGGTYERDNVIS